MESLTFQSQPEAEAKQAKFKKGANVANRVFDGKNCSYISFQLWGASKTHPMWKLYDGWRKCDSPDTPTPVPDLYSCRGAPGCSQVFRVPEAGLNSIQSNMNRHLETHFPNFKSDPEEKIKKPNAPSQYEAVCAVLAANLPINQFTRDTNSKLYHFLGRCGFPTSSPNTFKEKTKIFVECTVQNMINCFTGCTGCIMGDSSPDKLRREWVSFSFTCIDRNGFFRVLPLGINQAKGRMTQQAYGEHLVNLCKAWELQLPNQSDDIFSTLLFGATADYGPGLINEFNQVFNSSRSAPCMSHGLFNVLKFILKDSTNNENEMSMEDFVEELTDLVKIIKSKRVTLEMLMKEGMSFPSVFQKKRWSSFFEVVLWYLENYEKCLLLKDTEEAICIIDEEGDESLWNLSSSYDLALMIYAVFEPMYTLIKQSQTIGPLDAYVMSKEILYVLSIYVRKEFFVKKRMGDGSIIEKALVESELSDKEKDIYQSLFPAIDSIIQRLIKRFTNGSIGSDLYKDKVSGKKFDYLQLTSVLALHALSTDPGFEFLRSPSYNSIASDFEIKRLEKKSKAALWDLANSIYIKKKEPSKVATSKSFSEPPKRVRYEVPLPVEAAPTNSKLLFESDVLKLNTDSDLKKAFEEFYISPRTSSDRQLLLNRWLKRAAEHSDVLHQIVVIAGSHMLSNSFSEGNFSTVSRMLSPQMLRTGHELLVAKLLAAELGDLRQLNEPVPEALKAAKEKGKITSYCKPASLKMGDVVKPTPVTPTPVVDDWTSNAEVVVPNPVDHSVAPNPAATTTTTRPLRAGKGSKMNAIIKAIYKAPRTNDTVNAETNEEPDVSDDDSDYDEHR